MYDFWLGTEDEIAADEARYLLAIKRMMPRWINSLPDSEFLAIAQLLDGISQRAGRGSAVFVETGVGASTLALAYYAMKHGATAISWDLNSAKGSAIRTVISETMGARFRKHVDDHWRLVGYDSLSPYLGLPILGQLVDHVDFFMHDSEHVWATIQAELSAVTPLLTDGGIVALDDANLTYRHTNVGYLNVFRRKIGLPSVDHVPDNESRPFYLEVEDFLGERFEKVERLPDQYKERFAADPYFGWYAAEFAVNKELGAVAPKDLEHRFDSWRVAGRRA